MIEVSHITKSFKVYRKQPGLLGSFKSLFRRDWLVKNALSDVSFTVAPGEIIGLLGGNGAGKTTLVKILSGIVHPSQGECRVHGYIPWKGETGFKKIISLVMGQKSQLWWDLPAEDCFLLLKDIYNIPTPEYKYTLSYLAETLKVQSKLNFQVRRLSLGERMKMELIASLLHSPKVLFLDEPTIGLDLTTQKTVRRFLLEYLATHSPSIILTSHYLEDIKALCKNAVILKDGKRIYWGDLQSLHLEREKRIHVKFDSIGVLPGREFPWGQVVAQSAKEMTIKVPEGHISDALIYLGDNYHIKDLSVSEADFGATLENILSEGETHEKMDFHHI